LADEFFDLFNQLFYSTEVWSYLGILAVVVVCLLFSHKVKGAFAFCFLGLMLMGVMYFDQVTAGGFFTWHVLIALLGAVMCIPIGVDTLRKD